ncbi:MAG TPA: type 2 lanthipeptide synthetase LanM family protein [bacterium]
MKNKILRSSEWYNALTLKERITSLSLAKTNKSYNNVRLKKAKQYLNEWRSQPPFDKNPQYFLQQLGAVGLNENELLTILAESAEALQQRTVLPEWLKNLDEAFSQYHSFKLFNKNKQQLKNNKLIDLLLALTPLIIQAFSHLTIGVQELTNKYRNLPFCPNTINEILFANLPSRLEMILCRTIILELNVARLQNKLKGRTPITKYKNFLRYFRKTNVLLNFLREYPVLARQINLQLNNWIHYCLEFLNNLCQDWSAIITKLNNGKNPGHLIQVSGNIGDSHRMGRAVIIAKFSSGFQIVYKPKPLMIEEHFQELLSWLNNKGINPPFRTMKILSRKSYGWEEYINVSDCMSIVEIRRFYRRIGGYLALLYILEATDFHFENVIAAGENPMLIDLESLFHPHSDQLYTTQNIYRAIRVMEHSVLRIGILPQRQWISHNNAGIDISGSSIVKGQLWPDRIHFVEKAQTDEIHLSRKYYEMPGGKNNPKIKGREVNIIDYSEYIIDGFTDSYRLLKKNRTELLSKERPLANFFKDEIRIIFRPSRIYGLLLYESFHPDLLHNALDRERFFNKLWIGVNRIPHLSKLIPFEIEDLQNNDIPMFTTHVNSRNVWSSSGKKINGLINKSGHDIVKERIKQLDDKKLLQQQWFIRSSLSTVFAHSIQTKSTHYKVTINKKFYDKQELQKRLVHTAKLIGVKLESLAFKDKTSASWIGVTLGNENNYILAPLSYDLYGGLPGIILFLAYLGKITNSEHFTSLARLTLNTLLEFVENNKSDITMIGAFSGLGGLIYTLTHLGILWNSPSILNIANKYVNYLSDDYIKGDNHFDILAGSAGCICSLTTLYQYSANKLVVAKAIKCGERLLQSAQNMEKGIGWINPTLSEKPLTGLSHGNAGIAMALFRLATILQSKKYKNAALKAIAYERDHYLPNKKNWEDLRNSVSSMKSNEISNTQRVSNAWCNGAPGIGLARLDCLHYLNSHIFIDEINIAIKATIANGFGYNHSLCHGDIGNLELLIQASEVFENESLRNYVNRVALAILNDINDNGFRCGILQYVETPGLMIGLAGIGYGLLRIAAPKIIPSVLTLAGPKHDYDQRSPNKYY